MPRQKYQNEGLIPRLFAGLRHTNVYSPNPKKIEKKTKKILDVFLNLKVFKILNECLEPE